MRSKRPQREQPEVESCARKRLSMIALYRMQDVDGWTLTARTLGTRILAALARTLLRPRALSIVHGVLCVG